MSLSYGEVAFDAIVTTLQWWKDHDPDVTVEEMAVVVASAVNTAFETGDDQ